LDYSVDAATHQAFTEMLTFLSKVMNKVAHDQRRQYDENYRMAAEIHNLREENSRLCEEVTRLSTARIGSDVARDHTNDLEEKFVLERTIRIHDAPVHSVTMSPNSEVVATASWDGKVNLYNLAAEEIVKTLGGDENQSMNGLYAVAFAKTAPEIVGCASCDHSVYLWDHRTGRLKSQLKGHTHEVNGIDFHTSQQVMCTASDDSRVIIWDFQEGMILRTLDKHTKQVYGATFLGRENQYYVATCSFDQKTRVFDMRDKQVVALLQMHTDEVIGIDYSSHGQVLATGSDDGSIGLWCTRTWKLQHRFDTKEHCKDNEVKRVSFSPGGDMLAAACSSKRVLVYNINQRSHVPMADLSGHTDCVFDATWGVCPQTHAKILVSASHDHTCRYWQMK